MYEVWVRPNRRAILFGAALPAVLVLNGLWLMVRFAENSGAWVFWFGAALLAFSIVLLVLILWQLRVPRVAYCDGQVLFHLQSGSPLAVPLELVEAFFLGQGPLIMPGAKRGDSTVNLVARISQRDPSYAQREVKPALGAWCDSYVTMRGTWCEPLDGELIRRLNRRLREVSERGRIETVDGCAL